MPPPEADPVQLQNALQGGRTIRDLNVVEKQWIVGQATALIDFRTTAAQPREDGGTGFLLPGGWLLTCWHVIPTENRAKDADIYFGARRNREGWREQGKSIKPAPDKGFFTGGSQGVNDWTLVRLDPSADLRQWGHVVLDPSLTVKPGKEACIIQHPGLKPAKIAEGTLQFTGTLTFSYAIETENGSSGAPVLNTFGEVIALHSRSNDSQTNAGIPITRIIEAIKNEHNSPWLEIERLGREIRLQVGLIMAAKNETLRSRFGVDGVDTLRGIAAQDSALSNPSRIAQIYCQIMERVDLPDSASGEQQPFLLIEELAAHSHPAALIVFATWLRALSAADAAMVSLEKLDKWILSAMSETKLNDDMVAGFAGSRTSYLRAKEMPRAQLDVAPCRKNIAGHSRMDHRLEWGVCSGKLPVRDAAHTSGQSRLTAFVSETKHTMPYLPVARMALFLPETDMSRPWNLCYSEDLIEKKWPHQPYPTILRLDRKRVLPQPPDPVKTSALACALDYGPVLCGLARESDAFFTMLGPDDDPSALCEALRQTSLAFWARSRLDQQGAQHLLAEIEGTSLADLPGKIHALATIGQPGFRDLSLFLEDPASPFLEDSQSDEASLADLIRINS